MSLSPIFQLCFGISLILYSPPFPPKRVNSFFLYRYMMSSPLLYWGDWNRALKDVPNSLYYRYSSQLFINVVDSYIIIFCFALPFVSLPDHAIRFAFKSLSFFLCSLSMHPYFEKIAYSISSFRDYYFVLLLSFSFFPSYLSWPRIFLPSFKIIYCLFLPISFPELRWRRLALLALWWLLLSGPSAHSNLCSARKFAYLTTFELEP